MIRSVFRDAREAIGDTRAMIAARPRLVLLFVVVQIASNLLRLWLGSTDAASDSLFLAAAGGLFVAVRICFTQWLHVAAARLSVDADVAVRRAFAVTRDQALWFHGLVLVSIAAFLARQWLGRATGGFFSPNGVSGLDAVAGTAAGLFLTYFLFMPLQPGWFAVLTGRGEATLRWSLRAIAGQLGRALATVMLLVLPPAILRLWVFDLLRRGGWWVLLTASLDAALTVLLMLLATCVYRQTWQRGLARDAGRAGIGEAAPAA